MDEKSLEKFLVKIEVYLAEQTKRFGEGKLTKAEDLLREFLEVFREKMKEQP